MVSRRGEDQLGRAFDLARPVRIGRCDVQCPCSSSRTVVTRCSAGPRPQRHAKSTFSGHSGALRTTSATTDGDESVGANHFYSLLARRGNAIYNHQVPRVATDADPCVLLAAPRRIADGGWHHVRSGRGRCRRDRAEARTAGRTRPTARPRKGATLASQLIPAAVVLGRRHDCPRRQRDHGQAARLQTMRRGCCACCRGASTKC